MASISTKFGLGGGGVHYSDPWLMTPASIVASSISEGTNLASTVAFFTNITGEGVIDTTNWSDGVYKTIYSHTGFGLIAGAIGPTAGAASTTTFRFTLDNVVSTITVTNASTERAFLSAAGFINNADFTTAGTIATLQSLLDSGKTTLQTGAFQLPSLRLLGYTGAALLRYNVSATVEMKHTGEAITNSTATAYSAVLVRKGIAA